jgi:anaerobic selenocysteine-containing dehydrogenase
VRALAVLMSVLGTIDAPGGFRHKAPYPRHIVPNYRAFNDPEMIQPNTPLNAAPLGFRPARTSWRSTPTARRCASTTRSPGSTRCRRTA